jgi:hypothetical protein
MIRIEWDIEMQQEEQKVYGAVAAAITDITLSGCTCNQWRHNYVISWLCNHSNCWIAGDNPKLKTEDVIILSRFRGVTIDGVWMGKFNLLNTRIHHSELHFTVHWHTQVNQSITVCTSRFLVTDLTQWRFFSFRGHAVACWLTLHNWTPSAIFSISLAESNSSTNCSLGTPKFDCRFWVLCYDRRSVGQSVLE